MQSRSEKKIGLVLSGGGARGAYQAGVLSGFVSICEKNNINPKISIVTAVSAGAVNGTYWAAHAHDLIEGARQMKKMWSGLTTDRIFKSDFAHLLSNFLKWGVSLGFGGMGSKHYANSLFDTKPLDHLLGTYVDYKKIQENLKNRHLDFFAITAIDYLTNLSLTFVQTEQEYNEWKRVRRVSEKTIIHSKHVLGSCAIPLLFPPVRLGNRFLGDGNIRNVSPLSPAIHLGADKIFVIGVRAMTSPPQRKDDGKKNLGIAQVFNTVLKALILDATEFDLERFERINSTLDFIDPKKREDFSLRKIECYQIHPQKDIASVAQNYTKKLPQAIHYMIRGIGSEAHLDDVLSYILFDGEFCARLIEMGEEDILRDEENVLRFLKD